MKAMIFSAGLGTRFKPWTDRHPKALAPVNGKPLLQRNIEYLQQYGITEVVVNVYHFADQVIEAIMKNKGWGSNITISDERDALLDTGGGLLKAEEFFTPGESFLTCNADILTDLNISYLVSYHKNQNSLISFGVTKRETSRYLLFDENDRLCGWRNTKTSEEKGPLFCENPQPKAYSCVVVFNYLVFELMRKHQFNGKFSLIDVYLTLCAEHRIYGFDHTGDRFADVGKPDRVAFAESLFP